MLQQSAHEPPPRPPRSPSPSLPSSPPLSPRGSLYNDEIIVSLINEFYSLLVSLDYLRPSQIIYPPPGTGHNINKKLCNSLNIDVAVIELMKRTRYVDGPYEDVQKLEGFNEEASAYGCHLFPGPRGYSFLRGDDIVESRDPENDGVEGVRLNYLLSHDVALSHCLRGGMILVLDTKANTVRVLENNSGPDTEGTVLERPEEPSHYRNCHPQDAPSYFRYLIEKVRSLELIPSGPSRWHKGFYGYNMGHEDRDQMKKILIEEYGWPDNFRQEAWARDAKEIWERIASI
ncbi:hypothetical protein NA56DRAFT_207241 [Hyaloscypha hepaticicola]|uniref:Uncharacterized protein n=1 Tax=Hyaloscypha hepaticicola TaxID=2082293 RepID=A0A2J6PZ19_9HELO|nr:hypothetical protein NA56DRAFT_207241 [Hyaloscypha hepaticicola]